MTKNDDLRSSASSDSKNDQKNVIHMETDDKNSTALDSVDAEKTSEIFNRNDTVTKGFLFSFNY